jgi:hypothetical protein
MGVFLYPLNTAMNTLQQQALNKLNIISMGNGGEHRLLPLFDIRQLTQKHCLSEQDIAQLTHFVNSTRDVIQKTSYVCNTVIHPNSWGHEITSVPRKIKK